MGPAFIQGFSYGPLVWPLASLKGSELWAPIWKGVDNGVIVVSYIRIPNSGPILAAHKI